MTYNIKITPLSERETLITKRLANSTDDGETIHDFRSEKLTPKVIALPINIPVYRMGNCRTFSAQQSEIALQELASDFFVKGQELAQTQQIQHSILAKLSKQGTTSVTPIYSLLETEGQRKEILITSSGVVVNGNRRLSALRELYNLKDGAEKEKFSHVLCAVLPSDTTPDEIDDIEADLQARPQSKLDYDWIGDAQLVRRQVSKQGRTSKQVADRLRRSKIDIENVLQALDEADLYLSDWVEKPGRYELVSGDGQQIFGDIPKSIAKKDLELQNASRAIAWSLFENRDRISGRVYNLNPAFGKLAPKVLDMLGEQLDFDEITVSDDDNFEDNFAIEIDDENGSTNYLPIIQALRNEETKEDAVSSLIEVCETAIELDRGQKSEKAGLKALSAAHAKLTGVDVLTSGKKYLPAMLKQIESIGRVLSKIEGDIDKRQSAETDDNSSSK